MSYQRMAGGRFRQIMVSETGNTTTRASGSGMFIKELVVAIVTSLRGRMMNMGIGN